MENGTERGNKNNSSSGGNDNEGVTKIANSLASGGHNDDDSDNSWNGE
jgi:hypothetical protein